MATRLAFSVILAWFCAFEVRAQDDTLEKIRARVADSVQRLPNYLCTETVERQTLVIEPALHMREQTSCAGWMEKVDSSKLGAAMAVTDRLRLDVALNSKGEMYSWVGEGQFQDRALSEIVNNGTTSSGTFGSLLRALFTTEGAEFTFKDKEQVDGRTVVRYDFVVPLARSGYSVTTRITRRTGYSGSFTADAETFDLLRLQFRTDPLPEELQLCRSSNDIKYTKIRMNETEVLIPAEVTIDMLAADGKISHNKMDFSGCHQFMGESKITFGATPGDADAANPAAAQVTSKDIPGNLKVTIALAKEIDPETGAAGDTVTGKLTRAIKIPKTGFEIPKGAKLHGRIVGLRRFYVNGKVLDLSLRWDTIEINGTEQAILLNPLSASPVSANLPMQVWIETTVPAGRNGTGLFKLPFSGNHYKVPAGFEMTWVTQ